MQKIVFLDRQSLRAELRAPAFAHEWVEHVQTRPEDVSFELDVLWAYLPGADPVAILEKYGARIPLMHVKDVRKGLPRTWGHKYDSDNDVTLGTGQLDQAAIFAAAKKAAAKKGAKPDAPEPPQPVHPAIKDPNRWWRYGAALDPELVVITPAMEGDTGLDAAGPIPLAEDGRFPEANGLFLDQVVGHGQLMATLAMAKAMGTGNGPDTDDNGPS